MSMLIVERIHHDAGSLGFIAVLSVKIKGNNIAIKSSTYRSAAEFFDYRFSSILSMTGCKYDSHNHDIAFLSLTNV